MIRANDIQESLLHLVGWQQHYDTTDLRISEALTQSESGIYFQQVHPLITLPNMSSIAPDFKNVEYPAFTTSEEGEEATTYTKGTIVKYGSNLYKALKDTTNDPSTEDWVETNPFSEWLEAKTKASIQKAVMRFCTEKIAEGTATPLCENRTLFEGTGRLADTIKNKHNFVGLEIISARSKGVTTRINKIGLQFTKAGDYTFYLMHSSSELPLKTFTVTKVKDNATEWFTLQDMYLPYVDDGIEPGGSYYLVYSQSELPEGSMAVRKDKDWSKEPCGSCSRRELLVWMAWSKYLEIHPFYVNEELTERDEENKLKLWDIENNQYTYDTNYGLNLDITVSCDITDFVIDQKSMFQEVISKQLAVDMLRELVYNPNVRTNRYSINASKTDILYEIDGDSSSMKKSGLAYQLDMAYKALKVSTSGIDRICLPCKNNGIKYRTI